VNWSIFGYISRGEMVPEVITTLLKRSNTVFMAIDGSRHLRKVSRDFRQILARLRQVKYGIWHCCVVGLKRLQNQQEA
jgi:hypothetical protein